MIKLSDFVLDRSQDSNKIFLDIKEFIDIFSDQKENKQKLNKFASLVNIPAELISLKFKRLIYGQFNPSKSKFILNNSIVMIFFYFILSLIYLLFLKIFGLRKIKNVMHFDVIIENVDTVNTFYRFEKLLNMFKNVLIISKNPKIIEKFKSDKLYIVKSRNFVPHKKFIDNKFKNFLFFFFLLFLTSIKSRQNLSKIFLIIFYTVSKSETIFNKYKGKILLQDRYYLSCPIKDFIFKKLEGKVVSFPQLHLAESGILLFCYVDNLLTFGDEVNTKKKMEIFGSKVKSTFPVGSLSMELNFYRKKNEPELLNDIDLLIIGINPSHWIQVSDRIFENYYLYLNWMKRFSEENRNLNIVYKHHETFIGDDLEKEILNDTNIKIVSKDPHNKSYSYLNKAKTNISYGSSMVLESFGLNKKSFFVDPNHAASTFYSYHEYNESLFLRTYNKFSSTIKKSLIEKENNFDSKICLRSDRTSENIYNYLKKYIN